MLQVSYMFIQLVAGCYRYTSYRCRLCITFTDVKHHIDLRSADKQQGAPAVIFRLHWLAGNELTGQNKSSVVRLKDTVHDHKVEPVTISLLQHLNVQIGFC